VRARPVRPVAQRVALARRALHPPALVVLLAERQPVARRLERSLEEPRRELGPVARRPQAVQRAAPRVQQVERQQVERQAPEQLALRVEQQVLQVEQRELVRPRILRHRLRPDAMQTSRSWRVSCRR
jgi:hypothetical protein